MCVDNLEMVKGMLKLNQPDLVMISLIGMEREDGKILSELKFNYSSIPVICIGTESEQEQFGEYFRLKQFHAVTNEVILERICEVLQITVDSDNEGVSEPVNERKRVLLVDDSAIQLRALNEMLKQKYEVWMASSGTKALTSIGKKVPDVIILDYEMPMCDGKKTLEMIRELEEAKDVPVVFLTGVRDKDHIEAVLKLKPAGYLLKPASADSIYEILDKVLG